MRLSLLDFLTCLGFDLNSALTSCSSSPAHSPCAAVKTATSTTARLVAYISEAADLFWPAISPNRKIFEARKRETAALGAGEKLVLGHPLAATIGDSARCMQNLEKVLFTGPKTSDTVTFICD